MSSSTFHPLAALHSNTLSPPLQDRRAISAAHRSSFSNSTASENSSPMSNANPADILRRRLSLSSPKPSHILTGPEKQQFRQRFPPTPLPEVLQTPSAFTGLFGRAGEMNETAGSKESREMRDRRGSGADYFSDASVDSEAVVEDVDEVVMPKKEADSGNGRARLSGDKEEVEKRMTSLKNNNFKRKPVPNNPSPVSNTNPTGTAADATRPISPLDFAIVLIKCSIGFFVACVTLGMILPMLFWSLVVLIAAIFLERAFVGTSESMVLKKLESVIEELNTKWPVIAA
ncbi:hypothetical protein EX30DRAFT_338747 [Ascodesmis nigricans]|uniref:Uncharacterized protein n=1 Tax=Ascodesmis nigricans TaxID=341454 RepID=A0A4S2N4L0_9PEZI|nr:hypothetical protein EX30DRAFT_338747 [Ascodesmis nigricans]